MWFTVLYVVERLCRPAFSAFVAISEQAVITVLSCRTLIPLLSDGKLRLTASRMPPITEYYVVSISERRPGTPFIFAREELSTITVITARTPNFVAVSKTYGLVIYFKNVAL